MYDVIVVGVGAMGSAALAELAQRGKKVLGLEAFQPAHRLGSSHGDSRIIRLGYHEDPAYVPLLQRAYRNWWRMERRLETDILTQTGVLQIGRADGRLVTGTLKSCSEYGLAHEVLDKMGMAERFPGFLLDDDEVGVLDPVGGYIRPETAVWGNVRLATADGAELHIGERVTAIEPNADGVTVRSAGASYRARKVIVSTGAWIADLVPALAERAVPIKQVVAWYQPADGFAAQPQRMPCFLRAEGEDGAWLQLRSTAGLDEAGMVQFASLFAAVLQQKGVEERERNELRGRLGGIEPMSSAEAAGPASQRRGGKR